MIRHAMDVVKAAVNKLNPGQVPVVTFDKPLYAIAKQVQWNWPNSEDWLLGCGWTQALVQAERATAGTADSFLRAVHVGRTKHAHLVTAAALHILQYKAHDKYKERATAEPLEFEAWCNPRAQNCPQFHTGQLHYTWSFVSSCMYVHSENQTSHCTWIP